MDTTPKQKSIGNRGQRRWMKRKEQLARPTGFLFKFHSPRHLQENLEGISKIVIDFWRFSGGISYDLISSRTFSVLNEVIDFLLKNDFSEFFDRL